MQSDVPVQFFIRAHTPRCSPSCMCTGSVWQSSLQPNDDRFGFSVQLQDFMSHLPAPAGLLIPTEGQGRTRCSS